MSRPESLYVPAEGTGISTPLSEQINLLGGLLGRVLGEQAGEATVDLVEELRSYAKEAVQILEENFGDLVFKSRIKKAIKFAEAPVRGSSLLKYDPKSNAADYYRELAEEVLTHGAP